MVAFSSGRTYDVGEAGGVVDADMDPLPARAQGPTFAPPDLRVAFAGDAVPRPLGADPAELLDVDVDQLTGPGALIAADRLRWLQAGELAEADPLEHGRDGRGRHLQGLGDLRAGQPHPPQSGDRLHALGRGGVVDVLWRGAAVQQPSLAIGPVAAHPFAGRLRAHSGGLGRLRERDPILEHSLDHDRSPLRAEGRVSVKLHPVPPCCWGFDTASLQGGPDEQRA